jgi:hypothetical protein
VEDKLSAVVKKADSQPTSMGAHKTARIANPAAFTEGKQKAPPSLVEEEPETACSSEQSSSTLDDSTLNTYKTVYATFCLVYKMFPRKYIQKLTEMEWCLTRLRSKRTQPLARYRSGASPFSGSPTSTKELSSQGSIFHLLLKII